MPNRASVPKATTILCQLQKLSPRLLCHAFRSVHSHFCFDCSCQLVVSFRRSFYTKAANVAVWRSVAVAVTAAATAAFSYIAGHLSNMTLAPLSTSLPLLLMLCRQRPAHVVAVALAPSPLGGLSPFTVALERPAIGCGSSTWYTRIAFVIPFSACSLAHATL